MRGGLAVLLFAVLLLPGCLDDGVDLDATTEAVSEQELVRVPWKATVGAGAWERWSAAELQPISDDPTIDGVVLTATWDDSGVEFDELYLEFWRIVTDPIRGDVVDRHLVAIVYVGAQGQSLTLKDLHIGANDTLAVAAFVATATAMAEGPAHWVGFDSQIHVELEGSLVFDPLGHAQLQPCDKRSQSTIDLHVPGPAQTGPVRQEFVVPPNATELSFLEPVGIGAAEGSLTLLDPHGQERFQLPVRFMSTVLAVTGSPPYELQYLSPPEGTWQAVWDLKGVTTGVEAVAQITTCDPPRLDLAAERAPITEIKFTATGRLGSQRPYTEAHGWGTDAVLHDIAPERIRSVNGTLHWDQPEVDPKPVRLTVFRMDPDRDRHQVAHVIVDKPGDPFEFPHIRLGPADELFFSVLADAPDRTVFRDTVVTPQKEFNELFTIDGTANLAPVQTDTTTPCHAGVGERHGTTIEGIALQDQGSFDVEVPANTKHLELYYDHPHGLARAITITVTDSQDQGRFAEQRLRDLIFNYGGSEPETINTQLDPVAGTWTITWDATVVGTDAGPGMEIGLRIVPCAAPGDDTEST